MTKGFLSQLERGLSHASLATLRRIADAVGMDLAELLADPQGPRDVSKAPTVQGGPGALDALLTPVGHRDYQVLHATVEAGSPGSFGPEAGREAHFVYVLEGQVELRVDSDVHLLGASESMAFMTPCSYGWRNPTDRAARVLWVFSPPAL